MKILGISAFYHDSAAALLVDGEIVAAAQEERFSRIKHDARFPQNALEFCLRASGLKAEEIDHVVFFEKPFLKFERLLETYLAFAPRGLLSFSRSMPVWLREKLFQKAILLKELRKLGFPKSIRERLLFSEHHLSHAASAFFPSPFAEAAVLTADGVGEWAASSLGFGTGNKLVLDEEQHFPHSLGLLYSAFTHHMGFKVNSGEYKLMGLAPYGRPLYSDKIFAKLMDLKSDGSFRLDLRYFNYCTGLRMTNSAFENLFEGPARRPEDELTQKHMDLAASIQLVTEEVMLRTARYLKEKYATENLCMAGGVALNCVANAKILNAKIFKNIWIQPAAGDAGGALGAALAAHHLHLAKPRKVAGDQMKGAYLGSVYTQEEIESELLKAGAVFRTVSDSDLLGETVEALCRGDAIGWFQGRMEFGPRALGARSILADPRSAKMQSQLNLKVKFRESFRPFAPSVLAEDVQDWFDFSGESPYMLQVAEVKDAHRLPKSSEDEKLFGIDRLNRARSTIPAVTHIDYSARLQTVHKTTNARYHELLSRFKAKTACSLLVNTSFNVRGEPIVESPQDAFRCFMGTDIETLVIGNCLLKKDEQKAELRQSYHGKFELD